MLAIGTQYKLFTNGLASCDRDKGMNGQIAYEAICHYYGTDPNADCAITREARIAVQIAYNLQ